MGVWVCVCVCYGAREHTDSQTHGRANTDHRVGVRAPSRSRVIVRYTHTHTHASHTRFAHARARTHARSHTHTQKPAAHVQSATDVLPAEAVKFCGHVIHVSEKKTFSPIVVEKKPVPHRGEHDDDPCSEENFPDSHGIHTTELMASE